MEIRPTSTDALATAQAITVAPKAPENVPTRIKKLETAIFAAQRALLSSSEDQRTQIRKISEEFHLPTGRSFPTSKEHLASILSTLKERVREMKRKCNKRVARQLSPQGEEPSSLSNFDCGLLQNIVKFCDTDTIRNLALTSRSLCLKIHQLNGQTIERDGKDETKFFLQRIYNKEETLAKLRSSRCSMDSEYIYTHCIKELQRDKDIQRTYLDRSHDGVWDIPQPEEKNEDMTYILQYNQLKIKEFLRCNTHERKKMIFHENGTNTPLKNLIRKIAASTMALEEAINIIPRPPFENDLEESHTFETLALRFPNDPEILTLCEPLFRHAPLTMRNNKEVVLQAVNMDGLSLEHASDALRNDPEIVLAAVQNDCFALEFASAALKKDPMIVLTAVQNNGEVLEHASDELKNDPAIVLAVVQNDGEDLEYASDALKNDPAIVLAALKNDVYALSFASAALKNDPAFVLAAEQNNGLALEYASRELQNNPAIVLAAVRNNGLALEFASRELQNNRDIVLAAVQNNGLALEFARKKLKNDREIVLAAVQNDGKASLFASHELQNDPDILAALEAQSDDSSSFSSESSDDSSSLSSESSDDSSSYSSEFSDDSSSDSSLSLSDSSSSSSGTSVNSDHSPKFHSPEKKKSKTRLERITRLVTKETQARQHLFKKARVEKPTYVQPHKAEYKQKYEHNHR